MEALTVRQIRDAIEGLPDDAPVFVNDADGVSCRIASIEPYEGCDGSPAVAIELEDVGSYHEMDDPAYDKNNPGY